MSETNGNGRNGTTKWAVGIVMAAVACAAGLWVLGIADTSASAAKCCAGAEVSIAVGQVKALETERSLDRIEREQRYQRRLLEALARNGNVRVERPAEVEP